MKKKFTALKNAKKQFANLLLIGLLFSTVNVFAQSSYVKQVIVLNEGRFDYTNNVQAVPVTIGAYNPVSKTYSNFDTITEMRWASAVIVDDQNIYVAGDTLLMVYDKNSHQRLSSKVIPGIRKLALWNNHILVSRGEWGVSYDAYFQVYDKTNLNLVYQLDTVSTGIKYSSEGIAVKNDTAYLAVNNSFDWGNYKSLLGIIDLNGQTYKGEVDLGTDGLNPENVMVDGDKIFTFNNKNWDSTGSSVSIFNIIDRTHQTYNVIASGGGCGASVSAPNFIFFQKNNTQDSISRFNKTSKMSDSFAEGIPDSVDGMANNIYGMLTDTVNNLLYITATNYTTKGMAYIMQLNGTMIDSFAVGVSPGNMALDVRNSTAINELLKSMTVKIYPNPTEELITLFADSKFNRVEVADVLGKKVFEENIKDGSNRYSINLQNIVNGIYFLTVESGDKKTTYKVVKY